MDISRNLWSWSKVGSRLNHDQELFGVWTPASLRHLYQSDMAFLLLPAPLQPQLRSAG